MQTETIINNTNKHLLARQLNNQSVSLSIERLIDRLWFYI